MSKLPPELSRQALAHCLPGAWQQKQARALASAGVDLSGLPEMVLTLLSHCQPAHRYQAQALLAQLSDSWWSLSFDDGHGTGALTLAALAPWQLDVSAAAQRYRLAVHPQPLRLLGLQALRRQPD